MCTIEIRSCEVCGKHLAQGFTDGDLYVCEEHFVEYMDGEFNFWHQNDHEDDERWDGGYYDAYDARENSWYDTGFYWTEWQD